METGISSLPDDELLSEPAFIYRDSKPTVEKLKGSPTSVLLMYEENFAMVNKLL